MKYCNRNNLLVLAFSVVYCLPWREQQYTSTTGGWRPRRYRGTNNEIHIVPKPSMLKSTLKWKWVVSLTAVSLAFVLAELPSCQVYSENVRAIDFVFV
jgi:hypothetical protein